MPGGRRLLSSSPGRMVQAKSTTAPRLLQEALAVAEFVNADPIAIGLSAFRPESVALAAGRVMSRPA